MKVFDGPFAFRRAVWTVRENRMDGVLLGGPTLGEKRFRCFAGFRLGDDSAGAGLAWKLANMGSDAPTLCLLSLCGL